MVKTGAHPALLVRQGQRLRREKARAIKAVAQ